MEHFKVEPAEGTGSKLIIITPLSVADDTDISESMTVTAIGGGSELSKVITLKHNTKQESISEYLHIVFNNQADPRATIQNITINIAYAYGDGNRETLKVTKSILGVFEESVVETSVELPPYHQTINGEAYITQIEIKYYAYKNTGSEDNVPVVLGLRTGDKMIVALQELATTPQGYTGLQVLLTGMFPVDYFDPNRLIINYTFVSIESQT